MNGFSLLLLDILLSQAFLALPDLISANPSQRAWTHTPAAPKVPSLVSSLRASAFPDLAAGRRSTISWTATSVQGVFSGLQPFHHVQARQFACHPGGSHPAPFPGVGQPWLLLLGTPQFVTSPWSRYASRPNRAIDSGRTCTPQDSQPCRLHRKT
jgi:hypothetical protein